MNRGLGVTRGEGSACVKKESLVEVLCAAKCLRQHAPYPPLPKLRSAWRGAIQQSRGVDTVSESLAIASVAVMALKCVKKSNALAFHNSALLCRVLRCPKRRQRSECQGQESSSNAGRGVHRSVHQSAVHHGDGPGPVDVLDTAELSVACFNARYLTKNVPVVIQGHMNSWQGMKVRKAFSRARTMC